MIEAWKFYYFEQRLIIERVYRNHVTGTFEYVYLRLSPVAVMTCVS